MATEEAIQAFRFQFESIIDKCIRWISNCDLNNEQIHASYNWLWNLIFMKWLNT